MAYHTQSSFAAGELDPALYERTTFDKYQSGLMTLRNVVIGKTGRAISRGGQPFFKKPKYDDKKCILYSPPYTQYIIEWGDLYVRIHNLTTGGFSESAHDFTESDLPYIQFEASGKWVYIFRAGKVFKKMVLGDLVPGDIYLDTRFVGNNEIIYTVTPPSTVLKTANSGTGYSVVHTATVVFDGQESVNIDIDAYANLPINAAESVSIEINVDDWNSVQPSEIRIYRRPEKGIAFGFIGNAIFDSRVGMTTTFKFIDYGSDADYTHNPPQQIAAGGIGGVFQDYINPRCGVVYQQRLLLTEAFNEEAISASRTGFQNNFTRDFPLAADSALSFKAGSSGSAKVLRMTDNDGLLVFTTVGIYRSIGPLSPDNLALDKKGNWVIEEKVPPLEIPGGIIFVDKSTNTIRTLIYSNEAGGFPGEEVSIFSNHLFVNKKVVSWAFQDGDIPLIWVVMDDGSLNALTYQREHQMQAWSRHDSSGGIYESVTVTKDLTNKSVAYFVIKRGNKRYIERTTPRFVADIKQFVGLDSSITFNSQIGASTNIDVLAVDINDWEGALVVTSGAAAFANTAGNGAAGSKFRFFDRDGSAVTLTVTTFVSTTQVKVTPNVEFPSDQATGVTLYKVYSVVTGLDHLEGKIVGVMSDGYVVSSPLNTVERYRELQVVNGSITLPSGSDGAWVHVGLPYACDVQTLDIDTVEQKPTLLESRSVNCLYLKIYNTRGIFIGSRFSRDDTSDGLISPEERHEDIELGNIGNAAQKPETKRYKIAIPNEWDSNGRICIRQVDPLPFEILSIIPDLNIYR